LPEALKDKVADAKKGGLAKFIRIELPGDSRILTLAEVEVLSSGNNLAREGKAKQSSTSIGARLLAESMATPTVVSKLAAKPIPRKQPKTPGGKLSCPGASDVDSVRVFNRTDENLGKRLDGFTLKILDENRNPLFVQSEIAAPAEMIDVPVEVASQEQKLKRIAIQSLAKVGGKEGEVFETGKHDRRWK
jgi:hypothetical protein